MNIGERIRHYRNKKKITMKKLGEMIDLSEQAIGNYERGDRTPNLEIIKKIANALDVPVIDIIGVEKAIGLEPVSKEESELLSAVNNTISTNEFIYSKSEAQSIDKQEHITNFINDLIIEKPYDKKILDIKKKIDTGESLSDEDMKVINNNKSRKNIEKDFGLTQDISVMEYEKESYILFKQLLMSLGYNNETLSPYLFKKIKAQIELEINMLKEQR
ncbi:helix-turn-helix domain-containing protein [Clostridium beijerinckii]|uniref:helix-turn-helix domain-containing protein n=1 Tax=Clostridium beijerinckii TaxID=1520 RepID=UPI00156F497F|nr:helix-turn-helix transcriptional regulator [Clostridium beijerinckii]NRT74440.1 transcriptional regulator with XRE-family HTH domain [Clostridium beijerinckii]